MTLDAGIPLVIVLSKDHFADWFKFAGSTSVKLDCGRTDIGFYPTVCEILNATGQNTGSSFSAAITCSPGTVRR